MLTRLRHTQIYKILCLLISAFIFYGSTYNSNFVYAVEFGEIQYDNALIDYTVIDKDSTLKLADYYFEKALNSEDKQTKKEFLQKASGEYFILTRINPRDLYPIVQLARVYDFEEQNSYSKAYFFKALKIDKNNAATNYYFGEYYYKRDDYKRALYYYNTAFQNGYKENYDVLIRMATMYEKLGDLLRANQYYKKAFLVNMEDEILPDKIRKLESLRYQNTGYYHKRRRK